MDAIFNMVDATDRVTCMLINRAIDLIDENNPTRARDILHDLVKILRPTAKPTEKAE